MIAFMVAGGNWGAHQISWMPSGNLRLAMEMHINYTNSSTPFVNFIERSTYYSPDCDNLISFPLTSPSLVEDSGGNMTNVGSDCYTATNGDCHMYTVDLVNHRLYESYATDIINNTISSQCGIVWDLSKVYPPDGRGDQCTSTDAAGTPTTEFLFSADELVAGHIDHMLRVVLPNSRIRRGVYVHPATHAGDYVPDPAGAPHAPSPAPMYGSIFRLHANFDVTPYPPGVQVILNALKKYGMIVDDGGDLAIEAESDYDTVHKYSEVGIANEYTAISFLNVADFDVIDGGTRIPITDNCVRNGQ